jgi:hypothetical protein
MSSPGSPTRIQPPSPTPPARQSDLDLSTLVLSALASAAAAYVTSKLWAPGTLFSAAMTPVIVALVKEGLRKPTEVVTAAVPTPRGRWRSATAEMPSDMPERLEAGAPPPLPPPVPGAAEGPVRIYSTRDRRRRLRWRLAVITGLLGFAVCVVIYTLPELVAGHSVGRSGRATTLWGGKSSSHATKSPTKTITTTRTTTTQSTQPATTGTPAQSQTQPSQATPPATPAPTTPQTTPAAPAQTTTAPAPQPPADGQTPTTP